MTLDDDRKLVQVALDIDEGLWPSAVKFVESLGRWVYDQGRTLTDAQRERLEQILEQVGR